MKEEASEEMLNSDLNSNKTSNKIQKWLFFIFSFLFLFYPLLCCSDSDNRSPSIGSPITNIKIEGIYSISKNELLDLLGIQKGRILDKNSLKIGIKRAFLKNIFEDITIEANEALTEISIKVEEKRIIKNVVISGNNYFTKRFIKKHLKLNEGQRLNYLKIEEGIELLSEEMKKRGFPNPEIHYSIDFVKENYCNLIIKIDEGGAEIIRKIIFSNSEDIIKSYLNLSEGDIFDIRKVERFEKNIKDYYKKQGYINISLKYSFNAGILTLFFEKGKKLSINFIGNDNISSKTLMDESFLHEMNVFSKELVEEMVSRLVYYYNKQGFPLVSMIPIISDYEEEIIIDVYIYEGTRFKVKNIGFKDISIDVMKLKAILISKEGDLYDINAINSDRETISEFYQSLGFLDIKVSEPIIKLEDDSAVIEFQIIEGVKTLISNITFKNNNFFSDSEILKHLNLKEGDPYNEIDISDSRRKILTLYNKSGFLNAKVSIESNISDNKAQINFSIDEGEQTFFGQNVIIGNQKTKLKVIQRELQKKEGQPLDYSIAFREKQQVQRLGLFADVDLKLSDYVFDKKRDILYSVEEIDYGALEFGFGYGEYEKYRFFLDLSYKNLWGMNRFGSLRTELSSLEQRFILTYTEPWFLDEKIALRSLMLFENRKEKSLDTKETLYKLRRNTASIGLEKTLNYNFKADVYYDFSVVKTWDVKPDIILSREDIGTLIISGFRPGLIYDTRDSPFEPTSGILAGVSLKVASSLFFSETDFVKLMFYGNKYMRLTDWLVFALSIKGGLAKGFGNTTELPIVERFFLGGRTTVRGYAEDTLGPKGADNNPTGGNAFLMNSFELRFYAGKNIGVVGFLDGGNVWQKIKLSDISNFKFTTGIGLRYQTPVGPLRIDYGHKLSRETGESKGELHFSIGHAF